MSNLLISKNLQAQMKQSILISFLIVMFNFPLQAKEYAGGWELWYPYQYHNKQSQLVGVDIEAFTAIMNTANVQYTLAELPWKTHLHFVKTGKVDMAMGASWSEERCEYAYFSLPYRIETVNLFVKKGQRDNIKLDTLKDLENSPYIIGVESGYFYGDEYAELIKRPKFYSNISEVIDIEDNIKLLMSGHLNGFLADPNTVNAFIKKYRMEGEFEKHDVEIYSDDIYIMLSKKSTETKLLNKINQAIVTLTQQGKLQPSKKTPNKAITECNIR